jgi:UDP-glucose 4-epimerase
MTDLDPAGFRDVRVLVTGGLGFIGSNLAIRLVELGADVTLVDSLIPEYGGNRFNVAPVAGRLRVNVSDVRDVSAMRELVRRQDYVFNLAGQTSHLDSMTDPYTDLDINCRAQLSMLEACRHENPSARIVFASTRQVYGKPDRLPVDETHPCRPTDINGIHKLTGEAYHLLYHQVFDLPACALRLTNTYGPRMRIKDARQTFVGVWIRRLLEGQPFEIWGDGNQLRDFTYVDDCVAALLESALHPAAVGRVFNVGGLEVVSLRRLAELLVEVMGRGRFEVKPFPADRLRIDIGDYHADDRAIRTALGWEPRIALREGLSRTLEYFRAHLGEYV